MPPAAAPASSQPQAEPSGNPGFHDLEKEYKMVAKDHTTMSDIVVPIDSPVRLLRLVDRRASANHSLPPTAGDVALALYHYEALVSVEKEIDASLNVVSHAYLNQSNNIALQSNVDPFALGQIVVLKKSFTFEYSVGGTVRRMPLLSGTKLEIACDRPLSSKGSEYKAAITGRWYVVKLVGKNKHYYVKEWQRGARAIAHEDVVLVVKE